MPLVNLICSSCAQKNGGSWPESQFSTFQQAACELCGIKQIVTEPHNFRLACNLDGTLQPYDTFTLHDLYMAEAGIKQGAGG